MPPKNDSNSVSSLCSSMHMVPDLYKLEISSDELSHIADSVCSNRTITFDTNTMPEYKFSIGGYVSPPTAITETAPELCVEPKTIAFKGNATIVWWKDGTKTVVRLAEGEPYSKFHAFCAAVAKKLFGSASKIQKIIDEHDADQVAERKKAEEEKARQKEQEAKDRRYRKAVRREAKAMLKDDKHYHDVMEVYCEMAKKNKEESK